MRVQHMAIKLENDKVYRTNICTVMPLPSIQRIELFVPYQRYTIRDSGKLKLKDHENRLNTARYLRMKLESL